MIDFRTIAFFSGSKGETEFAELLDGYIRDKKLNGWNILFENDKYDEEQTKLKDKPIFENRIILMKIT